MSDYQQELIVVFFRRHNSKIISLAVVIILAVVGLQWYVAQRSEEKMLGAENFKTFRAAYTAWSENQDKGSDESVLRDLNARVKGLSQLLSVSIAPYSEVADLYRLILLVKEGSMDDIALFPLKALAPSDSRDAERAFLSELKYLIVAKALADSTEHSDRGRQMLVDLVRVGGVASVPAANSLAQLSNTQEEVTEAMRLITLAIQRQPWQGELLGRMQGELSERKLAPAAAKTVVGTAGAS
jgi:hypothetical protein